MARQGRKTKFLAPVRRKILEALSQGNYRSVAARYAGIGITTLEYWLEVGEAEHKQDKDTKHSGFYLQVLETEAEAERVIVNAINVASQMDPKLGLEFLSRKHPTRWSRKDKVTVEGGNKPVLIRTITVKEPEEAPE